MATSSDFVRISSNVELVKPNYVRTALSTTTGEMTQYSTAMIRDGYVYLTFGLLVKIFTELNQREVVYNHRDVAINLLGCLDKRYDWFTTGLDWTLALSLPPMIEAGQKHKKNFCYRLKI